MMIYSTRVTVGTAVTLLVPPDNQSQSVTLLNAGSNIVRIGGEDVTTTAFGLPAVPDNPNVSRTFFYATLNPGESIYGITASGQSPVNVWYQQKSD
jgi:hypothetical protein